MSAFGTGSNSNGQFWYGNYGFLYKKNTGVGARRSTKFNPGGNITCNSQTYLYNKYKPGGGGVGASSVSNRRAKNRLATVCVKNSCFPCYTTLGQYSNYTHNPNGYVPCYANQINPCSFSGILSYFIANLGSFTDFGLSVAWSNDGSKIAISAPNISSGIGNGVVYIVNALTGSLMNTITNNVSQNGFGFCLSWSPDNSKLAVGAPAENVNSGVIYILNPNDGSTFYKINNPNSSTAFGSSVSWSHDGTKIATSNAYNGGISNVYVLDALNGALMYTINSISGTGTAFGFGLSWSPDGTKLAIGTPVYNSSIGIVYIVNSANGNLISSVNSFTNTNDSFGYSVAWSSDGNQLAIGSPSYSNGNGIVYIVNPNTNNLLSVINYNASSGSGFGCGLSWSPCDQSKTKLAIGAASYNESSGIVYIFK